MLAGLAAGAFLFIELLRKFPMLPLLLASLAAAVVWDFPRLPPLTSVGGITVYPQDALIICLIVIWLAFTERAPRLWPRLLFLLLAFLISFGLMLGIVDFGIAQAVNESRIIVWVLVILAWFSRFRAQEINLDGINRALMATGWVLVGVAFYHAARYGLGGAGQIRRLGDGSISTSRILVSGQAMILVACLCSQMNVYLRRPNFFSAVSIVSFLLVIVAAQNRSTWIAAAIGILVILVLLTGKSISRALIFFQSFLLVQLIALTLGLWDPIFDALGQSATDTRTYESRTSGWSELIALQAESGITSIMFGQPFGTGFSRIDTNGQSINFAPHNWYVLILLRVGVLGLLAYLAIVIVVTRKLFRRDVEPMFAAIWLSLAAYCWFYSIEWYMAPIAGICVAVAYSSINSQSNSVQAPCSEAVSPRRQGVSNEC